MSGEKKRYRWHRGPLLIEENFIINSKSLSTTTTIKTEEEKHTENTRRKWYNNDEDDDDDDEDIQRTTLRPNETISEKIDRVLRKINAWTNETSTIDNNSNNNNQEQTFSNKLIKPLSKYDHITRRQYNSNFTKPNYNSSLNSFRRRCSSSTYGDPSMIKTQQISTHRPYSMTFIDEPTKVTRSCNNNNKLFNERPNEKLRKVHRQSSLGPNRYQYQRQSMYSPNTNLTSLSSMYGSDFFYPSLSEQNQHEYDNLTSIQNFSRHHYDPFPTIVVDCQRCSRSVDRSSLRDTSCQVPSDDELYQDIQLQDRKTSRSSPLYVSPRSSPPPLCHPPVADSLLAPYHLRRKHSLSSYVSTHNRSKSVPSSSSSISSRKTRLPPSLCPLPTTSSQSNSVPSTNTLLRSIKTSIHAMKKRLKDIRRLSEVGRSI
jgi:hypothetical protein